MEYFSKQSWVKFIVSEKWNDDKVHINFNLNKKRRDIKKKKKKKTILDAFPRQIFCFFYPIIAIYSCQFIDTRSGL